MSGRLSVLALLNGLEKLRERGKPYTVEVNAVGNLAVFDEKEDYVGYVDFQDGSVHVDKPKAPPPPEPERAYDVVELNTFRAWLKSRNKLTVKQTGRRFDVYDASDVHLLWFNTPHTLSGGDSLEFNLGISDDRGLNDQVKIEIYKDFDHRLHLTVK